MADVFLSYARQDEAAARRLATAMTAAGLDVWWDADLPAHRAYSEVIERNLEESRAVVVLWSGAAAKSQWVRAEADFARNAGKLVQARLDSSLPPIPFNQIQCADLQGWRGSASHSGWAKLRSSIAALVSGDNEPEPRPSGPSLWERLRQHRLAVAASLAMVVAAAVVSTLLLYPGDGRRPVLAVLPFRSLSAQDETLAAGMWEDTRTAIGRNPQLIVLGPKSAQEVAAKGEGAARKAADYLLEASVRTSGDRLRVSADLKRTKDGEQVWSQDFDRKLDDIFQLQSEIAREIEGHIRGRLAAKGGVTPEHIATSAEAYAIYNDVRATLRSGSYNDNSGPELVRQLQRVLELDPNFAPAWAALAQASKLVMPSQRNWSAKDNSEAYARKAIDLAPNLAAGHAALAYALDFIGPVARSELERAVELDPNDYQAQTWLGDLESRQGDRTAAIESYRRAASIEPLFWPAVIHLYDAMNTAGDQRGIGDLVREQDRLGSTYLGALVAMDRAIAQGNLAVAANIGLSHLAKDRSDSRRAIQFRLWGVLIQLGLVDAAYAADPQPAFRKLLWENDPRGVQSLESNPIEPASFFRFYPLTENACRVYLLNGRGSKVAEMYNSLGKTPDQLFSIMTQEGPVPEHFLYVAPLVGVALQGEGLSRQAAPLLAFAESKARESAAGGSPRSAALLARILAAQGRDEQALDLLERAIARRWLPDPPDLQMDLNNDPALNRLQGNPRFEMLRKRILDSLAVQRSKVDQRLLDRLKRTSASAA